MPAPERAIGAESDERRRLLIARPDVPFGAVFNQPRVGILGVRSVCFLALSGQEVRLATTSIRRVRAPNGTSLNPPYQSIGASPDWRSMRSSSVAV
jgi:hypothetical protein